MTTTYPKDGLDTDVPEKEPKDFAGDEYPEGKFSDRDKDRITKIVVVFLICATVLLTVTGSVSIYTSHVIQKMRISVQFATGTQGK